MVAQENTTETQAGVGLRTPFLALRGRGPSQKKGRVFCRKTEPFPDDSQQWNGHISPTTRGIGYANLNGFGGKFFPRGSTILPSQVKALISALWDSEQRARLCSHVCWPSQLRDKCVLCETVKIVAICYTTTENIGSREVARRQEKAPLLMAKVNFQKEKGIFVFA